MKRALFIFLLLLAAAVFGAWSYLPTYLIPKIEAQVRESCDKCELKIGSMKFTPAHLLYIDIDDILFEFKPHDTVIAKIKSIRIVLPWSSLRSENYFVESIVFTEPDVVYTDGDYKTVSTFKKPSLPIFKIDGSKIVNGKFRYNRHTQGTKASFHIQKINAELNALGNVEELRKQPTQLRASGQVENTGESHLSVTTFLWEKDTYIDAELKVNNQNLDDLSIFLKDNAGVTLTGTLLKGESLSQVRDNNLRTFLMATYNNFDLKFDPMYDRNEITTFFMNFYSSIMVNKKNTSKRDPKREFIDLNREPNEPIVGFMLRGLKEAAIHLVKAQPL